MRVKSVRRVNAIADEILAREGGYVDDPDDLGGATNHGVTIHTMRRLGLDLDGDGRVTKADVKRLTRDQARKIFLREYFERPRIDRLPEMLQASVFDMYVNAGSNAVKILQRVLNEMGFDLRVDGVIGPMTAKAAHRGAKTAPAHLGDIYGIARRNYYYALGDIRPANRKFARRKDGGKGGWIKRAEDFIAPEFHLSQSEHLKRVAAWG